MSFKQFGPTGPSSSPRHKIYKKNAIILTLTVWKVYINRRQRRSSVGMSPLFGK